MGIIQRSAAALRIGGDDIDPDEITHLLGKAPTSSHRRGMVVRSPNGYERTWRSGLWCLQAEDRSPGDLDAQIGEILHGLVADPDLWRALADRYDVDLFCGLWLGCGNEGIGLTSPSLRLLAARNIELEIDIYAPDGAEGDRYATA